MISFLKTVYSKILAQKERTSNALFGTKEYKKFVIISRSRTGSTLLMALLRSHPDIYIEGEIFKRLNGKSCKKIWERLFSKRPKNIQQVGFKLFYYHPFDEDKSVWDFLDADKNIAILHLRRENLLRAFVSQKIGEKTKMWTENIASKDIIINKTVSLDPKECEVVFTTITTYEKETKQRFKNHKTFMELSYEQLTKDKQGVMDAIFKELQVSSHTISSVLKKQNPEPMSQLVENYEALKEHFGKTEWSYLFE